MANPKTKARQKAAEIEAEDTRRIEAAERMYEGLNEALPFANVSKIEPTTPLSKSSTEYLKVPKEQISKEKAKEVWKKVFQQQYLNKDAGKFLQFKGVKDQLDRAIDDSFTDEFSEESEFDAYDVHTRAKLAAQDFEPSFQTMYKETVNKSVRPFMVRKGERPKDTSYEGLERARVRAALGYRADDPKAYDEYMKSRREARERRFPGDTPPTGRLRIQYQPSSWLDWLNRAPKEMGTYSPSENIIRMGPEAFSQRREQDTLSHEIAHALTIPGNKPFESMKPISEERKIKESQRDAEYKNKPAERIVRVPRVVKQALTSLYGTAPINKQEAKAMIGAAPSRWWEMVEKMVLEESEGSEAVNEKILNDIELLRKGNDELLDELLTVTKADITKETA